MKKFICLILSLMLLLSFSGCAKKDDKPVVIPDDKPILKPIGDKKVVKDGATEYKILLPENADNITLSAAQEFNFFFQQSTGLQLAFVYDNAFVATDKYISIGKTKLFNNAKIELDKDKLTTQGFKIKTYEDSIICVGVEQYGTLWSAYELLTQLINYEYFSVDTVRLNKNVTNLPLYDFDITSVPDIEFRATAAPQSYKSEEIAHRFRFQRAHTEIFLNPGEIWHNSHLFVKDILTSVDDKGQTVYTKEAIDNYLSTDKLADYKKQLCYTARGNAEKYALLLQSAFENLKDIAEKNPAINSVTFTIEDYKGYCKCDACKALNDKYKTPTASVIKFCNDLHRKMDKHFKDNQIDRSINIVFFAYLDYLEAPVTKNSEGKYVPIDETVKCDKGVYTMYAPIDVNYNYPLEAEQNKIYVDYMEQWRAVSDQIYLWTYGVNFRAYCVPYNSFDSISSVYSFAKNTNVKYIFDQSAHDSGRIGGFNTLREYMASKLGWKTNADIPKMTNDFFENYFKDAKEPMLKYFNQLRTKFIYNQEVLESSGDILTWGMDDTKYWDRATLISWQGLINEAYEKIKPLEQQDKKAYVVLKNHIAIEETSIRYLLLKLYPSDNTAAMQQSRADFVRDCMQLGIMRCRENVDISKAFD